MNRINAVWPGRSYPRGALWDGEGVNFVSAHDGFTLADVVAYNDKHNDANQEGNRDGHDNNLSWNCGVEGPADDAAVRALRRAHPVFRRRDFYKGHPVRGQDIRDIVWLRPEGGEMSDDEWNQHFARCLGVYLAGEAFTEADQRGRPVRDVNFLVLFNAHHEPVPFKLPDYGGTRWHALLDTAFEDGLAQDGFSDGGAQYSLKGHCVALLQQVPA